MMSSEVLELLIRTQLVASVAILALLALRRLVPLDPDTRIWLWIIPLVAATVSIAGDLSIPWEGLNAQAVRLWAHTEAWRPALLAIWLAGAAAAVIRVAAQHLAFLCEARRGRAGPAVVGVACQRIIMPAAPVFEPAERALIRAHEWEHIRRNDLAVRNVLALLQCLCWFNPLIHHAAAELRLDQELACDETVVRRLGRRRLYAETLLKCHTARPSPLGCHWLGRGAHPLEARLAALARRPASEQRRALMTALGLAVGLIAFAVSLR